MTSLAAVLSSVAQASPGRSVVAAAFLAVGFHTAIQSVEFELYMFPFLAVSSSSWPLLSGLYLTFGDNSTLGAWGKAALVAASFHGSLLTSIATYRLFFHRCRKFPGPVGARLSRFYATYLSTKSVQYHKELEKMMLEYGDFVRTGPREVTILRRSAVDLIYGPKSECRKASWYGQTGNDLQKVSLHMCRDANAHRQRRKAWDKALSVKSLNSYEPQIKSHVDALVRQLHARGETGLNVTDWAMYFSFDLIGQVGFSKDFGQLGKGEEHSAIRPIHAHIKLLGIFQTVPWMLYLLSSIPGAASAYSEIFGFCANEMRAKRKTVEKDEAPRDIASWLCKAFVEKDITAAPSAEALEDDSRILLLAGSDTTATVLSQSLYHLVKYPHEQRKLQALLDEAIPGGPDDWTFEKARSVAHLDHFISETMRLNPALMIAGPRETPAGGLQIDEVHIPGGVNVLVPSGQIHRDPRYWVQADEFLPERWGDRREQMGTDQSPYLPFLLGPYICPGRYLARHSVRAALSIILLNFDVSFAPGETGESFENDVLDTFVVTLSPLRLCFTPRVERR
ncbi:cytochrome P450 [Microdochium trichocladiopsis]|uniref:Cytochrome P450 n=1 Tax=Microdochium trichocladiopsis TaxID=1682393 RepID=A0A9P8YDJ3_9PEZI|nr:cytochrome P450 [Microdochium trichocladiopsis]KAH7036039.1 cytochrome P450 [Microdochium trichocladiopsis]